MKTPRHNRCYSCRSSASVYRRKLKTFITKDSVIITIILIVLLTRIAFNNCKCVCALKKSKTVLILKRFQNITKALPFVFNKGDNNSSTVLRRHFRIVLVSQQMRFNVFTAKLFLVFVPFEIMIMYFYRYCKIHFLFLPMSLGLLNF